jgi:2-methylcitrate dehydratase PrpD
LNRVTAAADARSAERLVAEFVTEVSWDGLPATARAAAGRCLVDLVGVAAGGFGLPQAAIVREHVLARGANGDAAVWFTGRRTAAADAAWANATAIESLDAHDGHVLTKGHAGVALLPGLLALYARKPDAPGAELLASLVAGYELATRLGIALHATAPDYHSSGAWNAVAVAIAGAAALGGRGQTLLHAGGIAEYFAPRGPMMRSIVAPTMVKDSSGWGCRVGVEAAELALAGFTGAPAELVSGLLRHAGPHRADGISGLWADLGTRWRIEEQYLKPYPVCRWAQPAVEAALLLQRRHRIDPAAIASITVGSFAEAVDLAVTEPADTEQAQYSLPFAVAAALQAGALGAAEVSGPSLADPAVRRLAGAVVLREVPAHSAAFPAVRRADVTIVLRDGTRLDVRGVGARGGPDEPLSQRELGAKFSSLGQALLGPAGTAGLRRALDRFLRGPARAGDLADMLGQVSFHEREVQEAVVVQRLPEPG